MDTKDLVKIEGLVKEGLYQQALEEHLWFHEASKSEGSLAGVRLSFAIHDWVELARKYPPAWDALISLQDENRVLLSSGKGTEILFHDFSAINKIIEQKGRSVELFLYIDKAYPKQAVKYFRFIEDTLIEEKHYHIVSKYMGDFVSAYEDTKLMREGMIKSAKDFPELNNEKHFKWIDDYFVKGVLKIIEVAIAVEMKVDAIEIQTRAVTYFENDELKQAIR